MQQLKNLLSLSLLFSFSFCYGGNPEMILADCPDVLGCISGGIVIEETLPEADLIILGVDNCGGVPRYQMNYKFEATSSILTMELEWNPGAPGNLLKTGLVSGCMPYGECIEYETCVTGTSSIEINATDLIIGHEYVVFVDGCMVSGVDFVLSLMPGSFEEINLFENIYVSHEGMCINSGIPQNALCKSTPLELRFDLKEGASEEYLDQKEATYYLSIDGPESNDYVVDNLNDFAFNLEQAGEYVICLESVEFTCGSYDVVLCNTFTVYDQDLQYGTHYVCQTDLESGEWIPDDAWLSDAILSEGYYEEMSTIECGCPVTQTIEVVQLDVVQEYVEVELCPDDYPYVYFEDFDFEYAQFDIETELVIEEGSVQRDYQNDRCDSLVYLVLINEDPTDRCSSCDLPVILEGSKIVYCIPFDNAALDVSGKRNIVEPYGIDFDDNGSTNNILWDAVFDGNADYVVLPDFEDLNTEEFSIDFKFNKDELFENGPKETLFSKGSTEDNIRLEIYLEQTTTDRFDLVASFYTVSGLVELRKSEMFLNTWYDITYVVLENKVEMYLDGELFVEKPLTTPIKGNNNDFLMGVKEVDSNFEQYFIGRLNDFKYWKQKLSAQAVLFLHIPSKEFEISYDYFLSCCAQATFRGVTIDISNPLDSVIVPNASSSGYDSLYILNYVQSDEAPELNIALAPQDLSVQYQQLCNERCEKTVDWSVDLNSLFTDNCGNVTITQSHPGQISLDESISYVEVVLIGTDDCGQSTSHMFSIELECLPSNVEPLPENNAYQIFVDETCIDENTNEICKFTDVVFQPGYFIYGSSNLQKYTNSSLTALMSINGVIYALSEEDLEKGVVFDELKEAGLYEVCLEQISNDCETQTIQYCQSIDIRGTIEVDYGTIETCRDNIEETLPLDISDQLRNLILSNPQETTTRLTSTDDCGCETSEEIKLAINERVVEDVMASICEGEIYDVYTESGFYTEVLEGANGCDSIINLALEVIPKTYEEVFAQICPDSMFMGYSVEGQYELLETNVLGCDSIVTINLEVLDATHPDCFVSSVVEVERDINVYPNPASDYLYISIENSKVLTGEVSIYNIEGRMLLNTQLSGKLNVSILNEGIYVLVIGLKNGDLKTTVFLKG